jgi:hypothetical protein
VAARAQLAALRAQVQPHFLFNALHTVVQLIPIDPKRAVEAAELVADLLRTTLEEQREEVTLGDEWRFVSRYLAVERIRFGDRLLLREDVPTARPAMGRRRTRVATRVRAARKDSSTDQRSWMCLATLPSQKRRGGALIMEQRECGGQLWQTLRRPPRPAQ